MSGEYAVLLNTDAILKGGAVKAMVEFMDKETGVGISPQRGRFEAELDRECP
jgi:hypothetical protein